MLLRRKGSVSGLGALLAGVSRVAITTYFMETYALRHPSSSFDAGFSVVGTGQHRRAVRLRPRSFGPLGSGCRSDFAERGPLRSAFRSYRPYRLLSVRDR